MSKRSRWLQGWLLVAAFSSVFTVRAGAPERTLAVGLMVDRSEAQLVAYSLKDRPWRSPGALPAPRAVEGGGAIQLEISWLDPKGNGLTQRIELRGLCLDHDGDAPAHIEGDTIRLHRESFLVELPENAVDGTIEVGYYRGTGAKLSRVTVGRLRLGAEASELEATLTPGVVHWPEEYGDTDKYKIYGNEAETDKRINVVLVPDGYTYAQKTLLEAHAANLVSYFRAKTPFAEHDPFINYTLVYAYSTQDGTDQCDCDIVRDTAMRTRFPNAGYACGNSGNRCLYYGLGNGGPDCDPITSPTNIVAAELRAPAKDVTLIMVNTTRYGGCGGSRAVYSAGNSAATEIAVHELGHSLAGLADEYVSYAACGSAAGGVNTSFNNLDGDWPEWIADLGAPVQGAQYYSDCIYRPTSNCDMRALGQAFCPVCSQQFALTFFGHWRVNPTAPIASSAPSGPVAAVVDTNVDFSIATRFAVGPVVKNTVTWQLEGPGFPVPSTVATDVPALTRSFVDPGTYTLTCEVVADTNFVKPEKTGANRDVASWSVSVFGTVEVSGAAGAPLLTLGKAGANVNLQFEDVAAAAYNVYVSSSATTSSFRVADPANGKKDCAIAVTPAGAGLLQVTDYDPDAGITGDRSQLFILVTADNGAGTEASLGTRSGGLRTADAYCAP